MWKRVCGIAVTAMVAVGVAPVGTAEAQSYPERPVRLIAPYGPGGSVDAVARILAEEAAPFLGQPLVVENRAGAAGSVGTDLVARSDPDGYTVLVHTSVIASEPAIKPDLPYDTLADLQPVMLISEGAFVVVVHPSVPAETIGELIEHAKERPGELNFGSAGVGSSGHLRAELFKVRAGIDMVHIPYVDGGSSLAGLFGNEVQLIFDTTPGSRGPIEDGRIRALAVTTADREPVLPDVPTMAESGMPDFVNPIWLGAFVPAGTPREIVDALYEAFHAAIETEQARERLAAIGMAPIGAGPDELGEILRGEIEMWHDTVQAAGITID